MRDRAVRQEADIRRTVFHPEQHDEKNDGGDGRYEINGAAPAVRGDQLCQEREKYELAGGVGGGKHAKYQAAALFEPAIYDNRGEDQGGNAAAGAHKDAPEKHQLPAIVHGGRKRDREGQQR